MDNLDTDYLNYVQGPPPSGGGPLCLLIVHNELPILRQFFAHYRAFGPMDFMVIDDHSTDGSREYLMSHDDVMVFFPKEHTAFGRDKRYWRAQLLDRYGSGRWCLAPDADEHLVWSEFENRTFSELLADLDAEDAQAYVADMVDMYADKSITDHIATDAPLIDQFPFFDDPVADPVNYRVMMTPSGHFRKNHPTPNTESYGGMRDRVFGRGIAAHGPLGRFLLRNTIGRSRTISPRERAMQKLISRLLRPRPSPLVITKLALVKWVKGMRHSGAQHHVTHVLRVSEETGAYLHFPITRGKAGLSYISTRGQHAGGSKAYSDALGQEDRLAQSPLYSGSKHYTHSSDLGPLLTPPSAKP